MANDCLVTKLKGSIVNDNIPVLGEFKIEVKAQEIYSPSEQQAIYINNTNANGKAVSIRAVGGYFAESIEGLSNPETQLTSYSIPANSFKTLYFANADYTIFISGKYDSLYTFSIYSDYGNCIFDAPFSVFKYATNIRNITVSRIANNNSLGDLSELAHLANLSNVYLPMGNFTGTLADLAIFQNLSLLIVSSNNTITGSIESLANNVNLGEIQLNGDINISGNINSLGKLVSLSLLSVSSTNIEGSIEEIASAMINNGRTSGTLQINASGNITYQGTPYSGSKTITFANGSYSVA